MPIPYTYSFARYLTAKKSVDDRALNRHGLAEPGRCTATAATPAAAAAASSRWEQVSAAWWSGLLAGGMLTHATYTAIDMAPTLHG